MAQIFDVSPEQIAKACESDSVDNAGLVCRNVFQWTENETVARGAQWLTTTPLRIVLILLVALVVNRIVRRMIRRFVDQMRVTNARGQDSRVKRMTPTVLKATQSHDPLRSAARAETIGSVLKSIATMVIFAIAILMALGEVGINLAPLIAGAGIVGVALGFGAQSLVKDFLSGLFMLVEDQYGVGDVIDVGEAIGTVEVVNLRTTEVRDLEGTLWHVPNGEIHRIGNMSQHWAQAVVEVDVAYDTELDEAMRVMKEVADGLWHDDVWKVQVIEEPQMQGIQRLGADGVTIRMLVKTQPGQQWMVTREFNRRIKERFDADGIEIPFPQRTMWVRGDADNARGEPMDLDG